MAKLMKSLFSVVLATVVSAAYGIAQASSVPIFSAPGIASPGYPNFTAVNYSVSLTGSAKSGFTLSIEEYDPNIGVFNSKNGSLLVSQEVIELVAHFDSTGHLLTNKDNSLEIEGSIAAWMQPSGKHPSWNGDLRSAREEKHGETLLFGADLTGFGVDAKDEALGFSTSDFSGWAAQFAPKNSSESLWLYSILSSNGGGIFSGLQGNGAWNQFLVDLEDHKKLKPMTFYGIGSIATVPLPSTAILLLGGLIGLFGFGARPVHGFSRHS
jgi:hypothetical protein